MMTEEIVKIFREEDNLIYYTAKAKNLNKKDLKQTLDCLLEATHFIYKLIKEQQ